MLAGNAEGLAATSVRVDAEQRLDLRVGPLARLTVRCVDAAGDEVHAGVCIQQPGGGFAQLSFLI